MYRVAARAAAALVLSVLAAAVVSSAAPASAADGDLGWVRLKAAAGKTDESVVVLTQSACPADAGAIVVKMSGPGIKEGVGNLVGATRLQALEETMSGQLWIPLQFVFDQWFLVNSVTPKPNSPYTLTVVCRDLLRSSKTFGSFVGTVSFDGKGGYRALGESAKAFNTDLKPKDPVLGGGNPPSPAASSTADPADSGAPAPAGPGDATSDAGTPTDGDGATDSGQEVPGSTTAAQPSPPPAADNTARNVILGGSLLLLAGIGIAALLGRLRGGTAAAGSSSDEPAGRRERDRMDVL